MRKATVFISSVLTTFALVMLYGVVKAYQNNAAVKAAEVATQSSVDTSISVQMDDPTSTPSIVTPQEAGQLAAQVLGQDNLLSAETSNYNGVDAYLITFTNNDTVYVGLDGQILSVQMAPMVVVNAAPPAKKNNNKNNQNNNQSSRGEHETHDD